MKKLARERIRPSYYYQFGLDREENWSNQKLYFYQWCHWHLVRKINRSAHSDLLNDKLEFYNLCQRLGIPYPIALGECQNNHIHWDIDSPWELELDFLAKSTKGSRGEGLDYFEFDKAEGIYSLNGKERLSKSDLANYLKSKSENHHTLVFQPILRNHEAIAPLTNGHLAVIRLITYRNDRKEINVFCPLLQCPAGENRLPYHHIGGNLYAINLESGFIEAIVGRSNLNESSVPQLQIPFWHELNEDAKKLHAEIDIDFIGWDVVVTNDGHFFLEGNQMPDLDTHQLPPLAPMFATDFGVNLLAYFEKLE